MMLIKKYAKWIGFAIVIVILGIYMIMSKNDNQESYSANQEMTKMLEIENESEPISKQVEIKPQMFVDVKGEVLKEGVYEIQPGDRVMDVIELAGGFTELADKTKVNLAAILVDEMVVFIPRFGEDIENMVMINPNKSEKVDLNDANMEELETLPGIGPSKAAAIVSYREEHGLFINIEDIMEVQGIGKSTFESLKEQIVVK